MITTRDETKQASRLDQVWNYPFMQAILNRRSRRFSMGATMNGGGLAYTSPHSPMPLTTLEEAILVTAATGVTGFALADLPYQSGNQPESGGGNVMASFNGRTIASADGVHGTALFILNDQGTFLLRRPQDLSQTKVADLSHMARERQLEELYQRLRVKLYDKRVEIPRTVPNMFSFNKWSTNLPGSTYFVPASDLTAMYINLLLSAFDEEMAFFLVDERNGYAPAGIGKFAKSRGGKLQDDLKAKYARVGSVQAIETIVAEFLMAEQSFMGHNMMLAEQAMGLGGWSHFATARPATWFEVLGFRMGTVSLSRTIGTGLFRILLMQSLGRLNIVSKVVNALDLSVRGLVLNLLNQNIQTPVPLGLEHDGEVLLKPYCPPYFKTMEQAVLAFLDLKYANLKSAVTANAWKDSRAVQSQIPKFSDQCIAATIAYADYIFKRYGQFPAYYGPFRMTLAHQAHHLDLSFYDKFYQPGAYTETQAHHMEHWH